MSEIKESLFSRVYDNIVKKRERILSGKINCIPWGLPRFQKECPGIEQGKYYLITAQSKGAKTQLTDWLFVYNTIQQIIDKGLNIKLKIFYITLEMSKEEKMLSCFSNILYIKEGIRIAPVDLKSTSEDKPLSEETLNVISRYKEYFDKIEEIVEFIDDTRNPTGIYNLVRDYALANGTIHYRNIDIKGTLVQVEDYYEPNNPDEYVMVIIDHVSLISPEKRNGQQLSLHESISLLSSEYLIKLRNRFNYIPVLVQQQALAGENIEHKKMGSLKPSPANLADNKLTIRDCNIALGVFSPFKNEMQDYYGYDITKLKDNCRFMEIMVSRDGGGGTVCPLYFDGATNFFSELPLPKETERIKKVYDFIENIKK
jgi:hypothetical protein